MRVSEIKKVITQSFSEQNDNIVASYWEYLNDSIKNLQDNDDFSYSNFAVKLKEDRDEEADKLELKAGKNLANFQKFLRQWQEQDETNKLLPKLGFYSANKLNEGNIKSTEKQLDFDAFIVDANSSLDSKFKIVQIAYLLNDNLICLIKSSNYWYIYSFNIHKKEFKPLLSAKFRGFWSQMFASAFNNDFPISDGTYLTDQANMTYAINPNIKLMQHGEEIFFCYSSPARYSIMKIYIQNEEIKTDILFSQKSVGGALYFHADLIALNGNLNYLITSYSLKKEEQNHGSYLNVYKVEISSDKIPGNKFHSNYWHLVEESDRNVAYTKDSLKLDLPEFKINNVVDIAIDAKEAHTSILLEDNKLLLNLRIDQVFARVNQQEANNDNYGAILPLPPA